MVDAADLTVSSGFSNTGTIKLWLALGAMQAPRLVVGGGLTNGPAGEIIGWGTLELDAGAASLVNEGTIAPGDSAGGLFILGDLVQPDTGVVEIEIGGYDPETDFDFVSVDGAATLEGTLDVSLISPFTPNPGDTFDVLEGTSGVFDFGDGPSLAVEDQGDWKLNWLPTMLQLEYLPGPATLSLLALGALALIRRPKR